MVEKKKDDEQPEETITVRALKECFMASRRQLPGDVFAIPASQFREDLMEVVDEKDAAKAERAEDKANEDRAHAGRVMSDPVTGHPRPKEEEPDRRKR